MAQWSQFEEPRRSGFEAEEAKSLECAACEALCPEAVDGTLTDVEQRIFEQHVAGCAACAREYAEAQRGAAWLGVLKGHTPEPPKALLERILAETTGVSPAAETVAEIVPAVATPARPAAPAWALSSVLRRVTDVFRIETARATFQPRLAMTAAMAFLSIALTLNMAGVRLGSLRASDFTPSGLRRSVADAGASVSRNFQNLRVVYQVESRVSELRGEGPLADRDDATFTQAPAATNAPPDGQTAKPAGHKKGL